MVFSLLNCVSLVSKCQEQSHKLLYSVYICTYDVRKTFLTSALRMSKGGLCSLSTNLLVHSILHDSTSVIRKIFLRNEQLSEKPAFSPRLHSAILQLTTHYCTQGYSFQLSFMVRSLALSTITCTEQYMFYLLLYGRVLCFCGQNIKIMAV